MRKLVLTKPKTLELLSCDIPKPAADQVQIRVERVGLCGSDLTIYRGLHPYVEMPVVMGHEISGTITAVGKNIKRLSVGERVAIVPHIVCGHCNACKNEIYNFCPELKCTGAEADGAFCDYFCIEEKMALPIPDEMSIEDAALLEPACVAYHGARRGMVQGCDLALVIGAGPIGNFCIQACKALGAQKVIAADLDSARLALAESLGADGTINSSNESLEEGIQRLGFNLENIGLFYDCVGEKGNVLNNILRIAPRGARIVVIGVLQNQYDLPNLPDFIQHEQSLIGTTMYTPSDYREMIGLITNRIVRTDGLISHHISLEGLPDMLDKLDKKEINTMKVMVDMA